MPFPADLRERFRTTLRACIGQRLCVGFSGGLDSTVLLHLLADLASEAGCPLSAIHVHHGLSAYADVWATHCEKVCAGLGVPLQVIRVVVQRDSGKGLEAAARAARHAALAQVDADWIVLAHHADDQAETLLHRLLRGTGVAGAGSMRGFDARRHLWRPLLGERRATLEAWAHAQGLIWVEDESNGDERLTRNFLRHQVMPVIAARFPAGVANLGRAAAHFAEASVLLDELAATDALVVNLGQSGSRTRFQALSGPRGRNLLRHWIVRNGQQVPDARRIGDLLAALCGTGAVHWQHGALAVCAYQDALWFEAVAAEVPQRVQWHGEAVLPWAGGSLHFEPATGHATVFMDARVDTVVVCTRSGGERMRLGPGRPSRPLKLLCQEYGLPPWWRDVMPILCVNDEVAWVGGIGAAFVPQGDRVRQGWRIEWRQPAFNL